ncbi:MAG: hypothetical protein AAFX06_03655 [Planctomycetota bacterium]
MAIPIIALIFICLFFVVMIGSGVLLWQWKGAGALVVAIGVFMVFVLGSVVMLSARVSKVTVVNANNELPPEAVATPMSPPASPPQSPGPVFPATNPPTTPSPSVVDSPESIAIVPAWNSTDVPSAGNPPWLETTEELFVIKHFPSAETAIGPLLQELIAKWNDEGSADAASIETLFVWLKSNATKAIESQAVESVQEAIPDSSIQLADGIQADSLTLEFELDFHDGYLHVAQWDNDTTIQKGTLRCTAHLPDGEKLTVSKQFDEKPWVHSFDRFVTNYPRRRFLVGYSEGVHSSEDEARRSAMQDIQNKAKPDYDALSYYLATEPNVVDRFAQKLERPYGVVWREAVLLEITEKALRDARSMAMRPVPPNGVVSEDPRLIWLVTSLGIVASLVVMLCTLLNWITEGYYRGRWFAMGFAGILFFSTLLLFSHPAIR